MFAITQYCQNDMQSWSVHRISNEGREVFFVPKHEKSVLNYNILYIIVS